MKTEQIKFFTLAGLPLNIVTTRMVTDVPLHPHDYFEIVFFQRGTAVHTLKDINGRVHTSAVHAGDCFAVFPGEYHGFKLDGSAFYYNLIVGAELLEQEAERLQSFANWQWFFAHPEANFHCVHLNSQEANYLEVLLKRLQREIALRRQDYQVCAKIILDNILMTILRQEKNNNSPSLSGATEEQVLAVITEMERHPENSYSLEKLAKMANICISRFTRAMRRITGCSPIEYLTNLRLQKAVGMFTETRCSLKEIATACGFCDENYLVKRFRLRYGVTPGAFRKQK